MKMLQFRRHAKCVVVMLLGLISGCSVWSRYGIQSVSIAPDDRSFAVAYDQGRESLLAVSPMDDSIARIVLRARDGTRYQRPIFSEDGRKLYFISRTKKDQGHVFVVDLDGSGLTQLTFGQEGAQDIRDIALSGDGDKIYYLNSGFYGANSPIATAHPHKLDFFSVNKDGTGLQQLSFSSSYALSGLAVAPDGSDIYSRFAILSLEKPGEFRPFSLQSPSRLTFTSEYPLSEISDSRLVLACSKIEKRRPGYSSRESINLGEFSAVYGSGLFLIDIDKSVVINEIVYLHSHLDSPALSHDGQRVLFIRNDSIFGGKGDKTLWSVNADGSGLRQIELVFRE